MLDPDPWHSRGYLPHFDSADVVQHVTFHLADSLPSSALAKLDADLHDVSRDRQKVERRKRIEAWIDAGYGSCLLKAPEAARLVQDVLLHFDGVRYRLLEWVVMPNHVHVLVEPMEGWPLSHVVASWKSFSGRRLAGLLRGRDRIQGNVVFTGARLEPGVPGVRVWHREYWDRYIRDERHFLSAVEYIRNNPVRAGLVGSPEEWPWGSAYARLEPGVPGDGAGIFSR